MRIRHFLHPEAMLLHDVIATEYWPRSAVPRRLGRLGRRLREWEDGAKFATFLFQVARDSGVIAPERADFAGWPPHSVLLASDDEALRRLAWREIDRAERAASGDAAFGADASRRERYPYRRVLGA
ncbi:hypothetical protein HQQ81_16715 [Microbacteriaceae bacterium VKM Ac-2854]|nr:hypothetical protein [Microbacteriaceae bacterium VKM Ac-2854]